jgi:PAS domain S-box-containing protein
MLHVEQDLVSLRRRTRAAGVELGLGSRDVESLSAAAYEAGRLLFSVAGSADATLLLVEGPALQVTVGTSARNLDDARRAVLASIERLRVMVHRLSLDETPNGLSVSLAVPTPASHAAANPGLLLASPPELGVVTPASEGLQEENATLLRALREMHTELEETNRGVVALYAELDDQAGRIRQTEDRLRVLLDSVHDYAICMLDQTGEVVSWNAGAERLFGYSADEIIGRNYSCFFSPRDRDMDAPSAHLREAFEHGRFESEGLRLRYGGSAFDAHVLVTPVRGGDGALRGFSLVVRDVTERKRLEDDLRRRAEDLAAANRAKEDFLATLSHELRTPLNAMLGWTRLLRMGRLDTAGRQRALETIERNAHVQEQLIGDILDVSRIVTGKLRLDLRPVSLEPIVDASLDAVRPTADAKGITLSCDVKPAGTVLGDPDRLQQVLWNLLANAIKFTPSGGRVAVSVARVGSNAIITVTDTGEGMPASLVPLVFDRFTQGDGSATRPHGGLGLGLSIVRHIVELHGGQVHASSDGPGLGSRFSVSLPVRAIQNVAAEGDPQEPPLTGLKVLVVDDDEDARKVVSLALAQCGAKTAAVGSAREALDMLPEFRPDVLVSDIAMPGEDGYSLIRRVRALGEQGLGAVPAVALTALAHSDDRRRALVAGYQQFIPKPVEADELAAVVRTLAGNRVR